MNYKLCDPDRTLTCDPFFRRELLYTAELQGHRGIYYSYFFLLNKLVIASKILDTKGQS